MMRSIDYTIEWDWIIVNDNVDVADDDGWW